MGLAHLESPTHILDILLGPGNSFPKQPECCPGLHGLLPWVSPPKGRLCAWYSALTPEGVQGTAVWGHGQSTDMQGSVQMHMLEALHNVDGTRRGKERGQTGASPPTITTFKWRIPRAQEF